MRTDWQYGEGGESLSFLWKYFCFSRRPMWLPLIRDFWDSWISFKKVRVQGLCPYNTETVSTSHRSLEKESCLIGWPASKIPPVILPHDFLLQNSFQKSLEFAFWGVRAPITEHTHSTSKIICNKWLLEGGSAGLASKRWECAYSWWPFNVLWEKSSLRHLSGFCCLFF